MDKKIAFSGVEYTGACVVRARVDNEDCLLFNLTDLTGLFYKGGQ